MIDHFLFNQRKGASMKISKNGFNLKEPISCHVKLSPSAIVMVSLIVGILKAFYDKRKGE